jgi:hypothetical protein
LKTLPKLFLRVNRLYLDKGAREISDYNEIDEAGIYNTTGKKMITQYCLGIYLK